VPKGTGRADEGKKLKGQKKYERNVLKSSKKKEIFFRKPQRTEKGT